MKKIKIANCNFHNKTSLVHCCDIVTNLVAEIGKWSNHDFKNCSEKRTVTRSVIWLWKLKFSIFVCLFVYLFVCTSRFANFARGKWSNHNSKNCSEIRAVTPFWIWLWNFQFETFIFFTALYCAKGRGLCILCEEWLKCLCKVPYYGFNYWPQRTQCCFSFLQNFPLYLTCISTIDSTHSIKK